MAELPVPAPAAPTSPAPRERKSLTPLQYELARALPALWNKANSGDLTASEQHKKLLDLVVWVAGKQGAGARQRHRVQFWDKGVKKDGQIDLALLDTAGKPVLVLEMDWTKNAASVAKLQAAHHAKLPILWIVGVPCKTKADAKLLRGFANDVTGRPTGWWLPIFHLVHGWI